MKVGKCSSEALALTNYLFICPRDFHPSVRYVKINNQFVFSIKPDENQPARQLGMSLIHRRWASLSLNQEVSVVPYDPSYESQYYYLGKLELEVGFFQKNQDIKEHFDTDEMSKIFCQVFNNQIFSIGQQLVFDFHGINLIITIKKINQLLDFSELQRILTGENFDTSQEDQRNEMRGVLTPQTRIHWMKSAISSIKLGGSSKSTTSHAIIQPDFKFEDMGIGGLDSEIGAIFRRAFASRIFPPSLVEKFGIQHVKGILLYGPPGTGKTLMARQIGKMLNACEPKVVNGPEILNKYVGQSEENIRKLFADAEKEYKEKGEDSGLHIIIFDELDAICKQRGSKNDGTGVGDSVVNQLLAKMDGVEQLNNILIIGMTNRLDMIDEALLRPGRLEVHMEIELPDENGRLQILKIHTSKMSQNGIMGDDVDLKELASLAKNFSGAEINGLVKSASSFAFNRHVQVGTLASVTPDVKDVKVNRDDFFAALDEVHPAFGVNDEEFQQCVQNQIIKFSDNIEKIMLDGQLFIDQVRKSSRTPLVSVLLHGPPGSGKTALAATMAMSSEFPFIKLISPENMVGFSETAKMSMINKVFNDSYKSPLSVIVVDNIERLLNWVELGPRFSNSILQTLLVLLKKIPPKGRRLLILATTNFKQSDLKDLSMSDCFNSEIYVPNIKELSSVDHILKELKLFDDNEKDRAISDLKEVKLNIGIKKLLMMIEMSRQDVDNKVEKFVDTIKAVNTTEIIKNRRGNISENVNEYQLNEI
ncbi:P-loop containing nucleoside triphosphate hydrolase protein [Glomus cerebriforme]|uniref:Vesicular-fusion protein SEC18 n=1 Tax=Glomus cerebriforme TaxID=658196 RepID=A0A397S4X0_9GLOM|nr:P-loop containing nucleoside triphosphate hydrolase protein [Glomus cerebriforme]